MAKTAKSGRKAAKPARAGKAGRKLKAALKPKAAPAKRAPAKAKAAKARAKPKTAVLKAKAAKAKTRPKLATKLKPSAKPKTATKKPAAKPKASAKTKRKPQAPRASAKPQAAKPQSLMARLEQQTVKVQTGRDWSATLFLPKTDFPMKAGLPEREPELLKRWERLGLYQKLRADAKGRETFVLHDGPPYANGHIHIGTGLNKILKDVIVRSQQMTGKDANYVPGWDCHGLPIEWKVEEENYRAKGKAKPDLSDSEAMIAFRAECRAYAEHWLNVQREEFKRLGGVGDWDHPYTTMSFDAEATIAAELLKFAMNGLLYRGSKPVMWSVVERTALAEAEVEYEEIESPAIYVKFPVASYAGEQIDIGPDDDEFLIPHEIAKASVVIWTTTPWTIPGNRAVSFSKDIDYGVYEVTHAPDDNWAKIGDRLILADKLAEEVFKAARVSDWRRFGHMPWSALEALTLAHPLRGQGYDFDVPAAGRRACHRGYRHGLRAYRARARHRGLRDLGAASCGARSDRGIDTRFPSPSTRRASSPRRRPASKASASSTTRASSATPISR